MRTILEKLTTVLANQAPPVSVTFASPKLMEEVAAAEKVLGIEFDRDLKEYLASCDGQQKDRGFYLDEPIIPEIDYRHLGYSEFDYGSEDFFDPYYCTAAGWLKGLKDILESTLYFRQWIRECGDCKYECFGPATYHDQYLEILQAENAYSIYLDYSPAQGGSVGQVVSISTQSNILAVISPNLTSFLELILSGYSERRFKKDTPDSYWRWK